MFGLTTNATAAPVTTIVFRAPVVADGVMAYAADLRCNNPTTAATVMSMLLVLARDAVSASPTHTNSASLFRAGTPALIETLLTYAPVDAAVPTDNDILVQSVQSNMGNAAHWLVDLINAAKKKPLTNSNTAGYFAMLGHDATNAVAVTSFINSIRTFYPDMIATEAFRNILTPGTWTTYRIVRVSTGIIMRDLLPAFEELGICAPTDPNGLAIIASQESPWDVGLANAIPNRLKAYASIFLEAAGTPIDDWYQGNKAVSLMPAVKVNAAKLIFRRYLTVKNATMDLATIDTVAGFQNAAITNFW